MRKILRQETSQWLNLSVLMKLILRTPNTPCEIVSACDPVSMGVALYVDVKRNPATPIVQVGPGQFMLKPGAINTGKNCAVH